MNSPQLLEVSTQQWLQGLKASTASFIKAMANEDYSYFRYSFSGDLPSDVHWGLGNTVFAIRCLSVTGLLKELPESLCDNMHDSIESFASGSYYFDPYITKGNSDLAFVEQIKRAETRQTFAALHLLGKKPGKAFAHIPEDEEGVINYLQGLNWNSPWAAASHFNHLLFFLNYNSLFFESKKRQSQKLIKCAVDWIHQIQCPEDGCWYSGNPPLAQKINGAMKVVNGLHSAAIYQFPHAEKLLDTALNGANDNEACSNFNIAYVLHAGAQNSPLYRQAEIESYLLQRLKIYQQFYDENSGGFRFHRKKANEKYYGCTISQGKNEADIHGTAMFLWGIAVIDQTIKLGMNFHIPIN